MSITFDGNISPTSSIMRDGCTDETNNRVCVVDSSSTTFRAYSLDSPFTQFGSNTTCLSSPAAICLINSASAVIRSSSVTTTDFIELSSNYRTNTGVSVGSAVPAISKGQQAAGDTSAQVAFFAATTAQTIVRVSVPANSIQAITIPSMGSSNVTCVILKSANRWLIGTNKGEIYEIDGAVNVIDSWHSNMTPSLGFTRGNLTIPGSTIQFMSYDNNLLCFTDTDGNVFRMDWSTKTMIGQEHIALGNDKGMTLSHSASGICLMSMDYANNTIKPIYEYDITILPGTVRDTLFTDSAAPVPAMGINTTNGKAWAIQNTTEKIRVFTVTPRDSMVQPQPFSLEAGYSGARVLLLDDTAGQGTIKIILDTNILPSSSYRIPTAKSLIACMKYGDGATAKWKLNRIAT